MKLQEALKQVEEQLKECSMDCDCECSSSEDESEMPIMPMVVDIGGEDEEEEEEGESKYKPFELSDASPTSERATIDPNRMREGYTKYRSLFLEENPCEAPASYSPSAAAKFGPAAGCVTREGKKGKFAPGYRPDPKKGFVKINPNAMLNAGTKSPHDDISEVQHWAGQPKK